LVKVPFQKYPFPYFELRTRFIRISKSILTVMISQPFQNQFRVPRLIKRENVEAQICSVELMRARWVGIPLWKQTHT